MDARPLHTTGSSLVLYSQGQTVSTPAEVTTSASSSSSSRIDSIGVINLCGQCKQEFLKLFGCKGCKRVNYCSQECQKKAWKTHQAVCQNNGLIPNEGDVVCKIVDGNSVRDITQKEFTERVGATYVRAPLFTKTALQLAQANPDLTNKDKIKPKGELESDSIALKYYGEDMGYGIVALRDIMNKEIICGFGGIVFSPDEWEAKMRSLRSQNYCIKAYDFVLDPSSYLSLGAVINDGPPNAELWTSLNYQGARGVDVPFDKIVVAVRDIKKDETICVEYNWDHSIKRGLYRLDEVTLNRLIQKYSNDLDISFLNKTGWLTTARMEDPSNNALKFDELMEIQYIFSTPYVLAVLHLRTDLDPEKTLKNLEKVSLQIQGQTQLKYASEILKYLAKISSTDKKAFLGIVEKISQQSLSMLCHILAHYQTSLSMEDCERLGKALDNLLVMIFGSVSGPYWGHTEEEEFKKQFFSEEHQRKIHDETGVQHLPEDVKEQYRETRDQYLDMVSISFLSDQDKTQLSMLKQKYQ